MVIPWQKTDLFQDPDASKLGWVSWSKPKLRVMQSQAYPWAGKQFHVQYQWWQPRNGFNPALKSRIQGCTAPETYHTLVAAKRLYHQRPQLLIVTSLEGLRAISLDKASHKNLEKALKLNINPQPVATVATEPWHSTWTPWKTANSWLESDWWRCTAHNMPKIQEVFKFLISSSHTSNKNMTSDFF